MAVFKRTLNRHHRIVSHRKLAYMRKL